MMNVWGKVWTSCDLTIEPLMRLISLDMTGSDHVKSRQPHGSHELVEHSTCQPIGSPCA